MNSSSLIVLMRKGGCDINYFLQFSCLIMKVSHEELLAVGADKRPHSLNHGHIPCNKFDPKGTPICAHATFSEIQRLSRDCPHTSGLSTVRQRSL